MLVITAFKYDQVSAFYQRSVAAKESGSKFNFEKLPLGNGEYRHEVEKVYTSIYLCTHTEIVGRSYNPNIFSLEENPELREWLLSIPYSQVIYGDDLLDMDKDRLPLLIKRIIKGDALCIKKEIETVKVIPMHPYYQRLLRYVKWGEALDVEPLIAEDC